MRLDNPTARKTEEERTVTPEFRIELKRKKGRTRLTTMPERTDVLSALRNFAFRNRNPARIPKKMMQI
jgi:hypothetical protein